MTASGILSKLVYSWLMSIALILLHGCAGEPPRTIDRPQATGNPVIDELRQRLNSAAELNTLQISVMAPEHYSRAGELYSSSIANASGEAGSEATRGLALLDSGADMAGRFARAAAPLVEQRGQAIEAGAAAYRPDEFASAEVGLQKLAKVYGDGGALEQSLVSQLIVDYRSLTVATLKNDIVADLIAAMDSARDRGIDDLAPGTMRLAEEEMLLATTTLEADRTRQGKSRVHASNAMRHLHHATALAAQIRKWRKQDAGFEDVALFYEDQLSAATAEASVDLDWSDGVASALASLSSELKRLRVFEAETALNTASSATAHALEIAVLRETIREGELASSLLAAASMRFEAIESLFSPTEAEVLGVGDDLLVRALDLGFERGSAALADRSLNMLNKLGEAQKLYAARSVVVTGYTDSTGKAEENRLLSVSRAQTVADFLISNTGIDPQQVQVRGFGAAAPLMPNDTARGRRQNRRVEILFSEAALAETSAATASQ